MAKSRARRRVASMLALLVLIGQCSPSRSEGLDNKTSCRSGGPADEICPCEHRCELQIALADQANTNCTCFVTPMSAGVEAAPKGTLILALNSLSLVTGTLVLLPFLRLKKKKTFPSNFVPHMLLSVMPLHLVYLATDYDLYTVYMPYEEEKVLSFNISPVLCVVQAFMAYFAALTAVSLCMFISISFFKMIVRGHKMKIVAKGRRKMLIFSYSLALFAGVGGNVTSSAGVYSAYCSVVDPLTTRLFFYIPILVTGITGVLFMIPVIKKVAGEWSKAGGVERLKTSIKTSGSTSTKKAAGRSGVRGLPLSVVVRMGLICVLLGAGVGLASLSRVINSLKFDTFFETPKAGEVGLTELFSSSLATIISFMFGVGDKAVTGFYTGRKNGVGSGASSASSVDASTTVTSGGSSGA